MENKVNVSYLVTARHAGSPSESSLTLYECATVDEACAFGLMLFRSSNFPSLVIEVWNATLQSIIVSFTKVKNA